MKNQTIHKPKYYFDNENDKKYRKTLIKHFKGRKVNYKFFKKHINKAMNDFIKKYVVWNDEFKVWYVKDRCDFYFNHKLMVKGYSDAEYFELSTNLKDIYNSIESVYINFLDRINDKRVYELVREHF